MRANLFDTLDDHRMVKNYLRILFGQVVIRKKMKVIASNCM